MKLEIHNNYDSELAESQGKVSKTNPILGIILGEVDNNGWKAMNVLNVAAGKNIKQIVKAMNIKESDITEFADLR